MSRYRFALRPRWVLSHLFVLALATGMITAGFWQLSRLQEKKDRNAVVRERTAESAVPVADLAAPGDEDGADAIEYRRVEASGTYLADDEVLVRSRSNGGSPGSWVLTPLDLGDGTAVVVNRGWIPNSGQHEAVPERYRAPDGEVAVAGLVRAPETRGRLGPRDPDAGRLTSLARADVARLDQQVDADLMPLYVQMTSQEPPAASGAPRPVPAPELDEGPHLSYAIQWFIFASIALVGYPLILRRRARELEVEARGEPEPGDPRLDPLPGHRDPVT